MSGLTIWKNNGNTLIHNADNLFWAAVRQDTASGVFIADDILKLYRKNNDKLNRQMDDFRFSKKLTAIYIDPTDKCNANCSYCYIPRKIRQNGRSMTADELNFILAKIKRYFSASGKKRQRRKQVIIFHAAEPLLVKDIIFNAIAKYHKAFKFGLQTNAILLEEDDVKFLKKYRVGVGLSLDSSISKINNRLRPAGAGGNFSHVIRAIEWFDGYSGLNVITTVTKFNVRGLPRIVKFLHKKKVPCVLMNPVRFTNVPLGALKPDDKLFAEYFIKAVEAALKLSENTKRKIIIGNFANTILAIIAPNARRLMCDISPCGGGRCFFTITAKGEMVPCGEFIGIKGFSGGNIFNDSIAAAMESAPFRKIRARIVEKVGECDICDFRNICGAPCPAELYSLGNMYKKSIFCRFYKDIIKYAFKLIAEDKVKYLLRDGVSESMRYEYNLNTKEG